MVYGLLSVLIPHFQDSFTSIQFTNIYGAPTVSLGLLWSYSVYKCLLSPYCIGEGNGNPLQYSCLENPMDGGAWWATVHGVAKSRT